MSPNLQGKVPVAELDAAGIARLRLHTQGVTSTTFEKPEEVVAYFGAMQSQEFAVAKWSIGQRTRGLDEAAVDDALERGRILRTHVMRPTWHFVRDEDIRWMLELTAPRVRAVMAPYDRKLELDEALYARSNDLIARAVEGGNHRTRKELAVALAHGGIDAAGQRLGHIAMRAELDGIVCSGRVRGKQHSYALIAERAPHAKLLDREEALGEIATRYFTSHGPATLKDFRWWSGLAAADARRAIEIAGDALDMAIIGERTYWLNGAAVPAQLHPSGAHLLQAYDECIVAYPESRNVLDAARIAGTVPGQVPYLHAIILDGQLAGYWKRQLRRATMVIEAQLLRPLDRKRARALDEAVTRYGAFVGIPTELSL